MGNLLSAHAGLDREAGYVNVNQPGMCYPEPVSIRAASDKAHNLGAVVANFRSAGARCIMGDVRFSALAGAGQVTSPDDRPWPGHRTRLAAYQMLRLGLIGGRITPAGSGAPRPCSTDDPAPQPSGRRRRSCRCAVRFPAP